MAISTTELARQAGLKMPDELSTVELARRAGLQIDVEQAAPAFDMEAMRGEMEADLGAVPEFTSRRIPREPLPPARVPTAETILSEEQPPPVHIDTIREEMEAELRGVPPPGTPGEFIVQAPEPTFGDKLFNRDKRFGTIRESFAQKDIAAAVPIAGGFKVAHDIWEVKKAVDYLKDVQSGKAEFNDRKFVEAEEVYWGFIEENERLANRSIPAKISEGIVDMLPYMAEFIWSGGVASLARIGARKLGRKVLGKYARRGVGRLAVKGAGWTAGGLARATTTMSGRAARAFAEKRLGDVALGPEGQYIQKNSKGPFEAAWKALATTTIEAMSEVAGRHLTKGAGKVISKTPGVGKLASRLQDQLRRIWNSSGKALPYDKALQKLGYHGVIEEIAEERLADGMRAVLGVEDFGLDADKSTIFSRLAAAVPDLEQSFVELGIFVAPAAVRGGLSMAARRAGRAEKAPPVTPRPPPRVWTPEQIKGIVSKLPPEERAKIATLEPSRKSFPNIRMQRTRQMLVAEAQRQVEAEKAEAKKVVEPPPAAEAPEKPAAPPAEEPKGAIPPRPLVNPHASALKQDTQLRAQQAWDKRYGAIVRAKQGVEWRKAGRRRIIEEKLRRGESVGKLIEEFPDLAKKYAKPAAKPEAAEKVGPPKPGLEREKKEAVEAKPTAPPEITVDVAKLKEMPPFDVPATRLGRARTIQTWFKKFIRLMPEFEENPVFTVEVRKFGPLTIRAQDGKALDTKPEKTATPKLVFQAKGKRYVLKPEFLGLDPEKLVAGQQVRVVLHEDILKPVKRYVGKAPTHLDANMAYQQGDWWSEGTNIVRGEANPWPQYPTSTTATTMESTVSTAMKHALPVVRPRVIQASEPDTTDYFVMMGNTPVDPKRIVWAERNLGIDEWRVAKMPKEPTVVVGMSKGKPVYLTAALEKAPADVKDAVAVRPFPEPAAFRRRKIKPKKPGIAREKEAPAMAGPAPELELAGLEREPKLVGRRDILTFLSEKLGLPIRHRRFRERALGIFKVRPKVIRLKGSHDVAVAAHEVGHALDQRFNLSSGFEGRKYRKGKQPFDNELIPLGKPTSLESYRKWQIRDEGVAEFFRLYLTNPAQAQKFAPKFSKRLAEVLKENPDVAQILDEAQRMYATYQNLTPLQRMNTHIIREEPKAKEPGFGAIHQAYRSLVDDLHPIAQFVTEATGEKWWKTRPSQNPYVLARMIRGIFGKVMHFVNRGTMDFHTGNVNGPSLKEALSEITGDQKQLEDFDAYIAAKHALELEKVGKQHGFERADIRAVVEQFDKQYAPVLKRLMAYQNRILQYAIDGGYIAEDTAKVWRKLYENYVPFYRVMEAGFGEPAGAKGRGMRRGLVQGEVVKRLKGSQRPIYSPLQNIIQSTSMLIQATDKNRVMMAMASLSRKKGAGWLMERVPEKMYPIKAQVGQIIERLHKLLAETGAEMPEIEGLEAETLAQQLVLSFQPLRRGSMKENIVPIFVGGKIQLYQLHPQIFRAVEGMNEEVAGALVRILAQPAHLLRAGVILDPSFMIRNILRDPMAAAVVTNYGFHPLRTVMGVIRLVKDDVKTDEIVRIFEGEGGPYAGTARYDVDSLQKELKKALAKPNFLKTVITHPFRLMRLLMEAGESATRLGQVAQIIKGEKKPKGWTERDMRTLAVFEARDLMDFSRQGSNLKTWSRITPFFNPWIQGWDKMARSMRRDPKKFYLRTAAAITIPSLLLHLYMRDDDDYGEVAGWEKMFFWHFKLPGLDGKAKKDGLLFRIPKPFELGILFGYLPVLALERFAFKQGPAGEKAIKNVADGLGPSNLFPQAMRIPMELMSNYNAFTGRPIESEWMKRLPPEERYRKTTSLAAKHVGEMTGLSPLMVEHAVRGSTGGIGRMATAALDKMIAKGTGEEAPDTSLLPFGTLVSKSYKYTPASLDAFYDELEKREQAQQKAKRARERGDTKEYLKARERSHGVKQMRRDAARLSKQRRQLQKAQTDDEKARIRKQMIAIARKYVTGTAFVKPKKPGISRGTW